MLKKEEKELKIAFGRRIREIRLSKGFSMRGFANEADMEYSQLARIENGSISPSVITVYKIAMAFDITLKELFDFSCP